jgi:hypothetical protein
MDLQTLLTHPILLRNLKTIALTGTRRQSDALSVFDLKTSLLDPKTELVNVAMRATIAVSGMRVMIATTTTSVASVRSETPRRNDALSADRPGNLVLPHRDRTMMSRSFPTALTIVALP